MNIKYKYRNLLTEGYNFTNADEVISAIKSNQVGVKIDPSFKTEQGIIPTKLSLNRFFNKCAELNIKDTTYGIQLLLSKCTRGTLNGAVGLDAIYEFLKSYRKPWVKQLPEYQEFMNNKYNENIWHKLEKAIQNEQNNHGKANKGTGLLKDVKIMYDDGTWKLLVPSSFEGEKAAAFYNFNGKETPTEWCTRCDKSYYNHYTQYGPLFIIRNMSTGNSYQLAFMKDGVEFLDQDDIKGDEITMGDLSKVPDNLLKLIKDPRKENGNTLLDYKKEHLNTLKNLPERKGYLKGQTSSGSPYNAKFGKEIDLGNGVIKQDFLNYSEDTPKNLMSHYFHLTNGAYTRKTVKFDVNKLYVKKQKATRYFLKDKPNQTLIYMVHRAWDSNKNIVDGSMITTGDFDKVLSREEIDKIQNAADKDFGYVKHADREDEKNYDRKGRLDKYNDRMGKQEVYDSIVDKVNEIINWKESNLFTQLNGFTPIPHFMRDGGNIQGRNIVKTLSFNVSQKTKLAHNVKNDVTVCFKIDEDYEDEEDDRENNKELYSRTLKRFDDATYLKADTAVIIWNYDDADRISRKEFNFCKKVAAEIQKIIIKDKEFRDINQQRKEESAERIKQREAAGAISKGKLRPRLYEEVKYFDY